MIHHLKEWCEYYDDVDQGVKTFEVRLDDRPFSEGDTLILQEFDRVTKRYTGRECALLVLKVYRHLPGVLRDRCVMQTRRVL